MDDNRTVPEILASIEEAIEVNVRMGNVYALRKALAKMEKLIAMTRKGAL